ncbi:MAG: hypothetical protein M0D57_19780 [Sphingobacteriales bacterium JAD_PAG50586_3]|nr:MAG: hypothetical protein M0D57_19780 [Sphingobacteriales bacterium JAD_PAG50586_3]
MEEPIQSTEQVLSNCPECDTAVVSGKIFCNKCGFPVNGTNEQKSEYDINKFKLKTQLDIAEKHIKNGSTILYVLAGLTVFGGILVSFGGFAGGTDGVAPGILFTVFVVIAAIFLGLGLWAKKNLLPPCLLH